MTGGLMLVHQHRAHKSVLFERYARQLQAQTLPSQQLLFPVEWEYFDNELALIDKHTPLLERLGIRFERGDGKIRVTAVPSGTETAQIKDFLDELLAYWAEDIPLEGNELDRFLARTLAEKTAIRTGQKLTPAQQQQLLSQLFQLAEPAFDPSGKRNFIILPVEDIDNRFE
jgi:DNA mismatch repair protein MutL